MPVPVTNFRDVPGAEPLPGFHVRRVDGDGLAVQEVRLAAGEGSDFTHAHAHEQILVMLEGRMTAVLGEAGNDRPVELVPGDVLHLPPNLRHGAIHALEDSRFLDLFGPSPD